MAGQARWHTAVFVLIAFWALAGAVSAAAFLRGAHDFWWTVIHPFTFGALTTAIVAYSAHFTAALTRTQLPGRGVALRVGLVQVALIALLVARPGPSWSLLADAAAALTIAALTWHAVVVWRAWRGALAGSFAVTVPFYVAAASFMVAAVVLAVCAGRDVGEYSLLIAAHSRAAVWGFALLTIQGTVVTLLPTLSGTRVSAGTRAACGRVLAVYAPGLLVSLGCLSLGYARAAGAVEFVAFAAACWLLGRVAAPVLRGGTLLTPAASALAGLAWLLALLGADAVFLLSGTAPRSVTALGLPVLVGAGLMQLVLGVLSHLVPTLRGGSRAHVMHGRWVAGALGPARLLLVNVGGMLTLLPGDRADTTGLVLLGLGLLGHITAITWSLLGLHTMGRNS